LATEAEAEIRIHCISVLGLMMKAMAFLAASASCPRNIIDITTDQIFRVRPDLAGQSA
jgi:hypothetical protein